MAAKAVFAKTDKILNEAERNVLEGSWRGQTYDQMAKTYGYSPRYLKQDIGCNLWQLLSVALGQKVTKKNFRTVLELYSLDCLNTAIPQSQAPTSVEKSQPIQDFSPPSPECSDFDNRKLYNALLRLDFRHQVSLFRSFIETHKIGSCLIHGEPEYGQRWLLNRLIKLIPHGTSAKVIQFGLGRKSRSSYIESLWRELGGRVGLSGQHPPKKIAEAVCQWWQTQTVILVFQDVDRMPKFYMNQFLSEFWFPVVELSSQCSPRNNSYRLFMFLIDYSGCVEQWQLDVVESLDSTWKPQILVKLPRLKRLSHRDLMIWMETGSNDLPVQLTTQLEQNVERILANSENGLPELVLTYLCSLCECNWYDWEQVWLKH